MKIRKAKLLALMLSASMISSSVAMPATAMADEVITEVSVEEAVEAEETTAEVMEEVTEAAVEDITEEATEAADIPEEELALEANAVPEEGEPTTFNITTEVRNAQGEISGMYSMENVVVTALEDGTYLVRMHQASVNRDYLAIVPDQTDASKDLATNHYVDWYVGAGEDGYTFVIPVESLEDTVYLSFSKASNIAAGKAWSNVMALTFDQESMTASEEAEVTAEEMNVSASIAPITLSITNGTAMFKAVTASLETTAEGTVLVMALNGTSYTELYKGDYEEAVANGDGSAANGNDSWIHSTTNGAGKPEFRIPLSENELAGSLIPLVAVSNSYYSKYLSGTNDLARAFYPRQIKVNKENQTLETGDLDMTQALTVTNDGSMTLEKAELNTIGGPNSNNYAEKLILTGTGFAKAFIGTRAEAAEAAEAVEEEDGKITLTVKANAMGGFVTTDYLDQAICVSFYDAESDAWTEYMLTASKADKSLTIEKAPVTVIADMTCVNGGVKLTLMECDGTNKYTVLCKEGENGKWKKAATTKALTYTKKSLKSGNTYYFKVLCLDKKGNELEGFDNTEKAIRYLAVPTLKTAVVAEEGITVTWKEVPGAEKYAVLQKNEDGTWNEEPVVQTDDISVTVPVNGNATRYDFTVACVDADGKLTSAYNTKGKHATYVLPGNITGAVNDGAKTMTVTWESREDAVGYQIQYSLDPDFKKGNKTVTISSTADPSKSISKLAVSKTYYVRIRVLTKVGKKKYYSAWSTQDVHVDITQ